MPKIYICARVDYDQYTIEAIFDEKYKHLADKWIERMVTERVNHYSEKCIIEEYELNEMKDFINREKLLYDVEMLQDGRVIKIETKFCAFKNIAECDYQYKEGAYSRNYADNQKYEIKKCGDYSFEDLPMIHMIVWAKNKEEAIQIVDNKRKELIENNKWEININE